MKWLTFDKENFRVLFRAFIATISLFYAGAYTWNVTFVDEGVTVSKHGEFILGFLLGTLVALLYNYYFGGNENDQTKNNAIDSTGDGLPDEPVPDGVSTEREDVSGDGT